MTNGAENMEVWGYVSPSFSSDSEVFLISVECSADGTYVINGADTEDILIPPGSSDDWNWTLRIIAEYEKSHGED